MSLYRTLAGSELSWNIQSATSSTLSSSFHALNTGVSSSFYPLTQKQAGCSLISSHLNKMATDFDCISYFNRMNSLPSELKSRYLSGNEGSLSSSLQSTLFGLSEYGSFLSTSLNGVLPTKSTFGLTSSAMCDKYGQTDRLNSSSSVCSSDTTSMQDLSFSDDPFLASVLGDLDTKGRKILGRGIGYYTRFGLKSVHIPDRSTLQSFMGNKMSHSPRFEHSGNGSASPTRFNTVESQSNGKSWKKKAKSQTKMECAFCKNLPNKQNEYKTHCLKDNKNKITCPILRAYKCPLCNNNGGDNAHTLRFCPSKRQRYEQDLNRFRNTNSFSNTMSAYKIASNTVKDPAINLFRNKYPEHDDQK